MVCRNTNLVSIEHLLVEVELVFEAERLLARRGALRASHRRVLVAVEINLAVIRTNNGFELYARVFL